MNRTASAACGITSNVANCEATLTVVVNGAPSVTSTFETYNVATASIPVTITAGAEKLQQRSKNAAMPPRITQQAVLAGVAAVVGGAMML
jgi:hypothetical protein